MKRHLNTAAVLVLVLLVLVLIILLCVFYFFHICPIGKRLPVSFFCLKAHFDIFRKRRKSFQLNFNTMSKPFKSQKNIVIKQAKSAVFGNLSAEQWTAVRITQFASHWLSWVITWEPQSSSSSCSAISTTASQLLANISSLPVLSTQFLLHPYWHENCQNVHLQSQQPSPNLHGHPVLLGSKVRS